MNSSVDREARASRRAAKTEERNRKEAKEEVADGAKRRKTGNHSESVGPAEEPLVLAPSRAVTTAFQIYAVLVAIARQLPIVDLINFRRVSKTWNNAFVSQLTVSHEPLQLSCVVVERRSDDDGDKWFPSYLGRRRDKRRTIADFLQLAQKTAELQLPFPFSRYIIVEPTAARLTDMTVFCDNSNDDRCPVASSVRFICIRRLFPYAKWEGSRGVSISRKFIFNFLHNFPALTKCRLVFEEWSQDPEELHHDQISDLSLLVYEQNLQQVLTAAGSVWPTVTNLKLWLMEPGKQTLSLPTPAAWTQLQQLHTVLAGNRHVHRPHNSYPCCGGRPQIIDLDEWLTGIHPNRFKTIERHLGLGHAKGKLKSVLQKAAERITLESLRTELSCVKTGPGLGDLPQLQKFVLDTGKHYVRIGGIGAYLGFNMANPTLQHLEITGDSSNYITIPAKSRQLLKNFVNIVELP